jgi:hypothetical protein
MRTHLQVTLATVALLLASAGVHAADVPFVSGGAGLEERQQMKDREREYNLKVVVAEVGGDYLADVKVVIESAKKVPVLDTEMDGPILLAKLPPGAYIVKATYEDKTFTKNVTVTSQGLRTLDFRWPSSEPKP